MVKLTITEGQMCFKRSHSLKLYKNKNIYTSVMTRNLAYVVRFHETSDVYQTFVQVLITSLPGI